MSTTPTPPVAAPAAPLPPLAATQANGYRHKKALTAKRRANLGTETARLTRELALLHKAQVEVEREHDRVVADLRAQLVRALATIEKLTPAVKS